MDPLALVEIGTVRQSYSEMTPRHELEAGSTSRWHEPRRCRGLRPVREYLHGRRKRTEQCPKRIGKLLRSIARLNPPPALDREPVPVRGGRLIARMEMAHIAKRPRECDRVAHPLLCEWART